MGGGGVWSTTKRVHQPLSRAPSTQAPEEFNVQTCLTHIWVIAVPFDCPVFSSEPKFSEPTNDLIYMQGRVGKLKKGDGGEEVNI